MGTEKISGKLIRDRVTEIAKERSGDILTVRSMGLEEFKVKLLDKVVEEAAEIRDATTSDGLETEISDLEQVIREVIAVFNLDRARIDATRERRLAERGGYSRRLLWTPTSGEEQA